MDKTTRLLLIALVGVGVLLAFFAGRSVFNLVKSWSLTSLPGAPVEANAGSNTGTDDLPEINITSNTGPEAKAWDGKSRVNILLLGLDASDQRELTERDLVCQTR